MKKIDNNILRKCVSEKVPSSMCNHVYLQYNRNAVETRKTLPEDKRRGNIWISYVENGRAVTEMYVGQECYLNDRLEFSKDIYWKRLVGFNIDEFIDQLKVIVADIFNNLEDNDSLNSWITQKIDNYLDSLDWEKLAYTALMAYFEQHPVEDTITEVTQEYLKDIDFLQLLFDYIASQTNIVIL